MIVPHFVYSNLLEQSRLFDSINYKTWIITKWEVVSDCIHFRFSEIREFIGRFV